jgi:biotin transport system substrate-specific component
MHAQPLEKIISIFSLEGLMSFFFLTVERNSAGVKDSEYILKVREVASMENTSTLENVSRFKGFLLSIFFAILTTIGAALTIPISLAPITVETFFVLMSGLLLGPKYGPLSQVLYLSMGLAGLHVFAGGTGGIQSVLSPAFGFPLAYPFVSWVTGVMSSEIWTPKGRMKEIAWYFSICIAGTTLLYAIALPYFYFNMKYIAEAPTGIERPLRVEFLPFVIGEYVAQTPISFARPLLGTFPPLMIADTIKAIVACYLAYRIVPLLRRSGLLPDNRNEVQKPE